MSSKFRIWKRHRILEDWKEYKDSRNQYYSEIKAAKANMWNNFLENAKNKDFFKTFAYTKNKRVERLPIIEFQEDDVDKKAITFGEKCQAFLKTLFKSPPESEPPN